MTSVNRNEMIDYTATYTDQYQLTMAQAYFLSGRKDDEAVFDYFFRKLPYKSGYAVFAGLENLLDTLENLKFTDGDLTFLEKQHFHEAFIEYLSRFRFRGDIFSSYEGDIVFPYRPVLQVESSIIEAQIIETVLLNMLNFQTLIATKASRMKSISGNRKLIDFGLRRSQGPGGYYASRAAFIGGFDATSNVKSGIDFDIPVAGTMAHSYVQAYDDEIEAFRDFARFHPDNSILLVDTYNTLLSGVPNAIIVGKEMEKQGKKLTGVRIDSGDLAYLAKESRKMLDESGLGYVKISVSNQLDEYIIRSLLEQGAPVDSFGVGTSLAAGLPDGALDGVYKLVFGSGKPRIKLSESKSKITIPHRKQVFRVRDMNGALTGSDVITLREETRAGGMHHIFDDGKSIRFGKHQFEPLLHMVMEKGKRTFPAKGLQSLKDFRQGRVEELPAEYKRFEYPHIYKIGLSDRMKDERDNLIRVHREEEK